MASSLQGQYGIHLNCPICMEMFSNPRALPCLHTFCMKCLHSYVTIQTNPGKSTEDGFECPVCRTNTQPPIRGLQPHSWAESFPSNYAVRGLIDVSQRHTIEKENEKGGNSTQLNKAVLKETSFNEVKTSCESHPDRPVEYLRESHTTSVCSICAALQHRKCEHVTYLEDSEENTQPNVGAAYSDNLSRKHRTLSRISRLQPLAANKDETGSSPPIDPNVLTEEFAQARAIADEPRSEISNSPIKGNRSNNSMKRLYGESFSKNIMLPEDLAQQFSDLATDTQENSVNSLEPLVNQFHNEVTLNLSSRSLELPGTLNDILEEDEEPRPSRSELNFSKSQLMPHGEFYIRIQTDNVCCSITGITSMPDGNIVLVDENNKNIKMFDNDGRYVTHLDLPSEPWDIDSIQQFEAVVAFPNEKCLRILLIEEQISVVRTINVDKKCFGVTYHNHEFLVAMETEVRIITYDGVTLNKINRDSSKKKFFSISTPKNLFSGAKYVVDSGSKDIIYVSDCEKGCVVVLGKKGNTVTTVKTSNDAAKTMGLAIGPNGKLFVCQWPNSLIMVSIDSHGSRIKHLLKLEHIQAVHFVKTDKKLWITRGMNNFVNVYTIKNDVI